MGISRRIPRLVDSFSVGGEKGWCVALDLAVVAYEVAREAVDEINCKLLAECCPVFLEVVYCQCLGFSVSNVCEVRGRIAGSSAGGVVDVLDEGCEEVTVANEGEKGVGELQDVGRSVAG